MTAGLMLGTVRALGKVGIPLMLAATSWARTNTMPPEIYNAVFNGPALMFRSPPGKKVHLALGCFDRWAASIMCALTTAQLTLAEVLARE